LQAASRQASGRVADGGPGSSGARAGAAIEDDAPIRRELAQKVEITDIGGEHAGAEQTRLQKNQRIIEELSLVPRPARQAVQAKQRASELAGLAPGGALRRVEAPSGNVGDDVADGFQDRFGGAMGGIKPPEGMRRFTRRPEAVMLT
jgi:hypothetical protein